MVGVELIAASGDGEHDPRLKPVDAPDIDTVIAAAKRWDRVFKELVALLDNRAVQGRGAFAGLWTLCVSESPHL